ncbi:hypothetical protein PP742_gp63 [Alcaligenes phage vB_Af_QDWS595]|uniref:Uncharacterized protein n=1 Tax=Alcaligenes phage vB_Af_QDWS595 TaxID=2877946 RepID=A0AAE8Y1E4_9CAUD|nr:hypothetical protein PP742_gp63 [Alcaligenes phage vB_Af_QDWS595]UCR75547.1 hypothetical protein vBAfaPQDWS595_63 [Alcaligenes phage vB_Af_QDWS595]
MNIYKITPKWNHREPDDYDVCVGAVVAAETKQDAAATYPQYKDWGIAVTWCSANQCWIRQGETYNPYGFWVANANRVKVELLATNTTYEKGVILVSSHNG